jgi:hypothetical protein
MSIRDQSSHGPGNKYQSVPIVLWRGRPIVPRRTIRPRRDADAGPNMACAWKEFLPLIEQSHLGGRPVLPLISVSEKIDRPDHKAAIFLKSPCVAFCIGESLYLRQHGLERLVLAAIETVKIDELTQCGVNNATIDRAPVAVTLKAQTLRFGPDTFYDHPERHDKLPCRVQPGHACRPGHKGSGAASLFRVGPPPSLSGARWPSHG